MQRFAIYFVSRGAKNGWSFWVRGKFWTDDFDIKKNKVEINDENDEQMINSFENFTCKKLSLFLERENNESMK